MNEKIVYCGRGGMHGYGERLGGFATALETVRRPSSRAEKNKASLRFMKGRSFFSCHRHNEQGKCKPLPRGREGVPCRSHSWSLLHSARHTVPIGFCDYRIL